MNRIEEFSTEEDPKGFRFQFFPIEDFFKIDDWLHSKMGGSFNFRSK